MKRIGSLAIGILAFAFYSAASQAAIMSATVTSATISKSTGVITVSGTIMCTKGTAFFIGSNIVQPSGGKNSLTSGIASGTCSGGTDTWIAPQATQFGSIQPGNADVGIFATDSGGGAVLQIFHQPVTLVP